MAPGSSGSRSKATDVDRSMNSSSHRIWRGSSGWDIPARVAMRMKPSSATWVETRKTRPFWTLATIRRPSRSPYMSVANESSPRTRSDASLGHGRPTAHRHRDVGVLERRRVVDAVAGDGDGPMLGTRARRRAEACPRGRRAHDRQARQVPSELVVGPTARARCRHDHLSRDRSRPPVRSPWRWRDGRPSRRLSGCRPCSPTDRLRDILAQRIGEGDHRAGSTPPGRVARASSSSRPPLRASCSIRSRHRPSRVGRQAADRGSPPAPRSPGPSSAPSRRDHVVDHGRPSDGPSADRSSA